ncbi:unnamed protein product [Ilex paraguariensis]|uniref:CCHC-type domain-containing protein n=1 Tax=Ilex paraguariensis TaxID=185542 RepID=A0ABC8UZD9_9AQUA
MPKIPKKPTRVLRKEPKRLKKNKRLKRWSQDAYANLDKWQKVVSETVMVHKTIAKRPHPDSKMHVNPLDCIEYMQKYLREPACTGERLDTNVTVEIAAVLERLCYRCHRPGHKIRRCPLKPEDCTQIDDSRAGREPIYISSANANDSADLKVTHRGIILVKTLDGGTWELEKVMYAKELSENLLSIHRLVKQNTTVVYKLDKVEVVDNASGKVLFEGINQNKGWNIDLQVCNEVITKEPRKRAFNTVDHGYTKPASDEPDNPPANIAREHDYNQAPCLEKLDENGLIEYIELGAKY